MSGSVVITCDCCGTRTEVQLDYALTQKNIPDQWVSFQFPSCRLHCCSECWKEFQKAAMDIRVRTEAHLAFKRHEKFLSAPHRTKD